MKTLVVDNGASTIKAGYSSEEEPSFIPNSVFKSKFERKRVFVADELKDCVDKTSLYYLLPFEKGYLVNWDIEHQVWDRLFGPVLNVDFNESRLVLTDTGQNVPAFRDRSAEMVFEDYEFQSLYKTSATSLVATAKSLNGESSSCFVIDSGYSFTHIIPYINGKVYRPGIVRIDVGGKALTNQLKEWISYRQLQVLDETYVMNQCKEDACFVSLNFNEDMKISRLSGVANTHMREYVLPDFMTRHRGELQLPGSADVGDAQKILLSSERFAIPEILFRPSDVDLNQMGIVEALLYSLSFIPEEHAPDVVEKIICIGGSSLFPNYSDRIAKDLRPLLDEDVDFAVHLPSNPITFAWQCAKQCVENQLLEDKFVTKAEYLEHGENICFKRFNNFLS
uniref:Actin-related protein 6 n=1 Tax=Acrobeloides nanus TaxID=290746 RepID=A0A914D0S6_9BILA